MPRDAQFLPDNDDNTNEINYQAYHIPSFNPEQSTYLGSDLEANQEYGISDLSQNQQYVPADISGLGGNQQQFTDTSYQQHYLRSQQNQLQHPQLFPRAAARSQPQLSAIQPQYIPSYNQQISQPVQNQQHYNSSAVANNQPYFQAPLVSSQAQFRSAIITNQPQPNSSISGHQSPFQSQLSDSQPQYMSAAVSSDQEYPFQSTPYKSNNQQQTPVSYATRTQQPFPTSQYPVDNTVVSMQPIPTSSPHPRSYQQHQSSPTIDQQQIFQTSSEQKQQYLMQQPWSKERFTNENEGNVGSNQTPDLNLARGLQNMRLRDESEKYESPKSGRTPFGQWAPNVSSYDGVQESGIVNPSNTEYLDEDQDFQNIPRVIDIQEQIPLNLIQNVTSQNFKMAQHSPRFIDSEDARETSNLINQSDDLKTGRQQQMFADSLSGPNRRLQSIPEVRQFQNCHEVTQDLREDQQFLSSTGISISYLTNEFYISLKTLNNFCIPRSKL